MQVGNNLNMTLSGNLSAGYSADFGNLTSSDHGIGVGGAGDLSGYYFNPNFLSFSASPYYNIARDNSTSFSTANASGVSSQVSLFGGSNFPGSISYSNSFNSQGSFDIPGSANFTTHGNSQGVGISWSARLHGLPSLSVGYQRSASTDSIYGTSQSASSSSHSLSVNSSYSWLGFNMGGAIYFGGSSSQFPELFTGGTMSASSLATNHGYTFTASHHLPWNGSSFVNYSSSTSDSSFQSTKTSFTVDELNGGAAFHPTSKLAYSGNVSYSSNLSGSIEEVVLAAGGVVPQSTSSGPSHSLDLSATASYTPVTHLLVQGGAERRTQEFLGKSYGSNLYTTSADYTRRLLGGQLSSSLAVVESTVDNNPTKTLGLTAAGTFSREFRGDWHVNTSLNYQQGVETLLISYTTSSYSFAGGVKKKWQSGFVWTASAGGSRTGLTGVSNNTASSDSVSTGLGLGRWASIGASYSTATGSGLLTASGVVTTPVPAPILTPTSVVLFGGKSYSYSIGSSPIRRLTLSAAYSRGDNITGSGPTGSTNTTKTFNSTVQYQFRQMALSGGFSRLTQGFSASGTVPQTISAYYINISRWFKFF